MPFQKGHKSFHTADIKKKISETHKRLGIKPPFCVPWNKGLIGLTNSGSFQKGHKDLVPLLSRKKAGQKIKGRICEWKDKIGRANYHGENAGYFAKHRYLYAKHGNPSFCEHCGKTEKRMYHWANKSGEYKREFTDWLRLCVPCHSKYDRQKIYTN